MARNLATLLTGTQLQTQTSAQSPTQTNDTNPDSKHALSMQIQHLEEQLATAHTHRMKLAKSYEAHFELLYEQKLGLTQQVACMTFYTTQLEKRVKDMEMAREYFLDRVERVEKEGAEKMREMWDEVICVAKRREGVMADQNLVKAMENCAMEGNRDVCPYSQRLEARISARIKLVKDVIEKMERDRAEAWKDALQVLASAPAPARKETVDMEMDGEFKRTTVKSDSEDEFDEDNFCECDADLDNTDFDSDYDFCCVGEDIELHKETMRDPACATQ